MHAMNDTDFWTLEAMSTYGGSFVKKLADCARMADAENLLKIKATWPEYWAQYQIMGDKLKGHNDD